jgi:hypothetical protein
MADLVETDRQGDADDDNDNAEDVKQYGFHAAQRICTRLEVAGAPTLDLLWRTMD